MGTLHVQTIHAWPELKDEVLQCTSNVLGWEPHRGSPTTGPCGIHIPPFLVILPQAPLSEGLGSPVTL